MKLPKILIALLVACGLQGGAAFADQSHAVDEIGQARAILSTIARDNAQYVRAHPSGYFAPLIAGQHPRATIVTCSDSRVHTHALDKAPDGDLFMIRNIGNQLATALGSVEYGVRHLHTPVLMIIGHSSCGAVTAAMSDYSSLEPPIRKELDTIHVAAGNAKEAAVLQDRVESNVHNQVAEAMKEFDSEIKKGELMVVGAVYDFRDDYHQGHGKLVIVDVNGQRDTDQIARLTQAKR